MSNIVQMDDSGPLATAPAELFPATSRCVFSNAPLIQVACQLKFPPILAIEGALPAAFQERIRADFPYLERGQPGIIRGHIPPEVLQLLNAAGGSSLPYVFLSEDRKTTLSLAPDSILLSTTDYSRWEHFRSALQGPYKALVEIYRPNFFTRIGLRYINAIRREAIGLPGVPWSKLLRQEILGELALPQFEDALEKVANRSLRLRLGNEGGSVLLRHGLATIAGAQPASSDLSYSIDMDFFREKKMELNDAEPILNAFHELAGRAFRWAIRGALYNALGPTDPVTGQPLHIHND
jgi:uncharacterized protein (TIGR04255 family)